MLIKIFDPRIEDVLQTILPKVLYREDAVGLRELVLLLHPNSPQLRNRVQARSQSAQVAHEGSVVHAHPPQNLSCEGLVLPDECDDGLSIVLGNVLGLTHPRSVGLARVLLLGVVGLRGLLLMSAAF